MIRILLSLAIAAAAFFGPWMIDSSDNILSGSYKETAIEGRDFVASTYDCVMDRTFSLEGDCEPKYGILGQLIAITIGLGVVSAVLSIAGLLPLVGRLTSLVTIIAGAAAIVTFAWFAKELLTTEAALFSDFRWGAYATGAFGVLTLFAGLAGLRGDEH